MASSKNDPAADFAQLARQYWSAWSDFGGKPDAGRTPGFQDGLAWWSQLAGQGREQVDSALERMNAQAGSWFGAMQQLAAGFAGREASPMDIGQAWREMLGGAAGNPVADMFRRMSGADAHGFEHWMAQVAPLFGNAMPGAGAMGSGLFGQGLRGEADALLRLPAFGLAREQQERLQGLGRAQLEYQDRMAEYNAQLARAGKLAFERFERKLGERSEPGRQIESARALFDLWIDAAEEAWGEVALSAEYRHAYGGMVNAQMRVRAALQQQIEQVAKAAGMPTRSEVEASHRKVAQLERELRALRNEIGQRGPVRAAAAASAPPSRDPPAKPHKTAVASPRATAKTTRSTAPAKGAKKPAKAASPAPRPAARRSVMPQVAAPQALRGAAPKTAPRKPKTARKAR
jgi:class III poly(R)-hydroxyalkanoic acid synthase PhaE subunit